MPTRALPARASLDHLKHEAKALHKAFRSGRDDARARVHDALGGAVDAATFKLTDAQRVIAREYGFPTWASLRAQVEAMSDVDSAIAEFVAAIQGEDATRARQVLAARPAIAPASIHVAAALGRADDVARLLADDPSHVRARAGKFGADPLLMLCFSPFQGESSARDEGLAATASLLLGAGADPNTRDAMYGVPALFAVTGRRSVPSIAKLLLQAGARPTDGESLHHAAERFHVDALELLLAAGGDLNDNRDAGNTPLHFLLRWYDIERNETVRKGVDWLLAHGADPNVRCGEEEETSLHLAARMGQAASVIRLLLDHGADVNARRRDGRTAWMLAARGGSDEIVKVLEEAGARREPLTALDALLAACGRGDAGAARRLASPELIDSLSSEDRMMLPHAASTHRDGSMLACLAAGFPIDAADEGGATALHHAAIRGRTELVRALLALGPDLTIRDRHHHSSPLGWACYGAEFVRDEGGDYVGCVKALLGAGARFVGDEWRSEGGPVADELRRAGVS